MKDRFYLACLRDNVGGNVAFHSINGRGYATDVSKAHQYTREEAQRAWELLREFDQPISADHVDALTVFKVDMQVIPHKTVITEGCQQYVGFIGGKYSGNDVYFVTENFDRDNDFSLAKKFYTRNPPENTSIIYIPYSLAESKKRRTFSCTLLNERVMTQGAGIKLPDHIKRYRRRKPNSGKTMMNCPSCGKINWQHNPYDFLSCSDRSCEEFSDIPEVLYG